MRTRRDHVAQKEWLSRPCNGAYYIGIRHCFLDRCNRSSAFAPSEFLSSFEPPAPEPDIIERPHMTQCPHMRFGLFAGSQNSQTAGVLARQDIGRHGSNG